MDLIWYHPAATQRDHKCEHVVHNKEIKAASCVTIFPKDQPLECLRTRCMPTCLQPLQWPAQGVFRLLHSKQRAWF